MQRPRPALATALASLMALSAGGALAQTAPPKGDAVHGKAIYVTYGCYQCHGYQGQGSNAGSRIAPNPMPFVALEHQLRAPRGRMPAYARQNLSDQDAADIHAYLLTIPKAKTVAEIPLLGLAP